MGVNVKDEICFFSVSNVLVSIAWNYYKCRKYLFVFEVDENKKPFEYIAWISLFRSFDCPGSRCNLTI